LPISRSGPDRSCWQIVGAADRPANSPRKPWSRTAGSATSSPSGPSNAHTRVSLGIRLPLPGGAHSSTAIGSPGGTIPAIARRVESGLSLARKSRYGAMPSMSVELALAAQPLFAPG
jgi:hypothetical protein